MDGWVFNRYVAVALVCFFIGVGGDGGLRVAIGAQVGPLWTESQPQPVPNIQAPNFVKLAERLKPAVVNISSTQTVKEERSGFRGSPFPQPFGERGERNPFQEFFERFFGGNAPPREFRRSSLGSGFIITEDGYIVTNSHVVENASDIKVSLSDKDSFPINLVKEVLPQLRETGKVTRGWLGVQVQEVTPELAQSFGLERPHGALVAEVQPNSPAEHAGIQRGDIIVTFREEQIEDVHELPRLVATTPPGTEANVQVIRNGQERTAQVKVNEMPGEPHRAALEGGTAEQGLGLTVLELTPELARRLELPSTQGVVVTAVVEGSPADEVGIRRGDVILEANQQQINNVQDYRTAVQRAGDAHSVLFLIRREGNAMYVAVRPEE
jgi:S1-C subfamily serine protease